MTSNPKINSILDEANRLFLLGKLQEALSYYDKILEEDPSYFPYPFINLGLLSFRTVFHPIF